MIRFFKNNWKILLIIVNLIIIAIAATIVINHKSKTATVSILVAPSDATVTLNGKEYKNGEYNVKPGEYHVEISKDGLESKALDFSLAKNDYYRLNDYLVGQNGSFDYYNSKDHLYDISLLEQIAKFKDDQELNSYLSAREATLSILSDLPIVFEEYTNNYNDYTKYSIEINRDVQDCPKALCLKIIDTNGDNKQKAIEEIKERGYNPDDYEIEYIKNTL